METNLKTFTSDQAQQSVEHHRLQAIVQLQYLIDDLTESLKLMQDGRITLLHNPEIRLKQVCEEVTKAQLMQRLHEHLIQSDTPNH